MQWDLCYNNYSFSYEKRMALVFSFELIRHPNIRYRESLSRLARCELLALLHALKIDCDVVTESIGNASFLTFECPELSEPELRDLARHSAVTLMAEKTEGGLLRPLDVRRPSFLEEDLAEVLKYKGKTGVTFTKMMLNMARSLLSPLPESGRPLLVADPVCGKGTTLFCALENGDNALGLEQDAKCVREAREYFKKYLEFHRLKHQARSLSETAGKEAVPVWECTFSRDAGAGRGPLSRTLRLACGDTSLLPFLARKGKADLLVGDLPYGIQHAPQGGGKIETFRRLLHRALPCWVQALRPGGVVALSYNTLTLSPQAIREELRAAGLSVVDDEPFLFLRHEVEHAVVRDIAFAVK